jgi:hypothetical protein
MKSKIATLIRKQLSERLKVGNLSEYHSVVKKLEVAVESIADAKKVLSHMFSVLNAQERVEKSDRERDEVDGIESSTESATKILARLIVLKADIEALLASRSRSGKKLSAILSKKTAGKENDHFVAFLQRLEKDLPKVLESVKQDEINRDVSQFVGMLQRIRDEDWYRHYFG